MAGRKPKPTAVKKLEGNPGKRKLNTKEPVPAKGMPDCPEWLDDCDTIGEGQNLGELKSYVLLQVLNLKFGEQIYVFCSDDKNAILPVLCQMEGSAGAYRF